MINEVVKKRLLERDKAIYHLHTKEGLPFRTIAKMYGISHERVRQIVVKMKEKRAGENSAT